MNAALATMRVEELLRLPMLQPDQVTDPLQLLIAINLFGID
jgi:hypothetical protein